MKINKIRFLEPGNLPYRRSIKNLYVYDQYIRTPSHGLMTLATVAKEAVPDTLMYSESISKIRWDDVLDADIVLIGIFTFQAKRGYELARFVRKNSKALVVLGGLHASMNYQEAAQYCDYVLLGEGEESILKLIDCLRRDQEIDFPGELIRITTRLCVRGSVCRRIISILFLIETCFTITGKWRGIIRFGRRFTRPEAALTLRLLCGSTAFRQKSADEIAGKCCGGYPPGYRLSRPGPPPCGQNTLAH